MAVQAQDVVDRELNIGYVDPFTLVTRQRRNTWLAKRRLLRLIHSALGARLDC